MILNVFYMYLLYVYVSTHAFAHAYWHMRKYATVFVEAKDKLWESVSSGF